jgi:hypothetical protein
LRGGSFAASFGRKPYGAAAAAHGGPGDRPPGVPAVSRCRARQHHGQAVSVAPSAPVAVKRHSLRAGTPRTVRAGPSSVKGTRRSFLTASQNRSSGPTLERRRPLPAQWALRRGPGQRPGPECARPTSARAGAATGQKSNVSFSEQAESRGRWLSRDPPPRAPTRWISPPAARISLTRLLGANNTVIREYPPGRVIAVVSVRHRDSRSQFSQRHPEHRSTRSLATRARTCKDEERA